VSINAEKDILHPQNRSKPSKFVGVIAVSNEYTSKIQGQYVSTSPLLGL